MDVAAGPARRRPLTNDFMCPASHLVQQPAPGRGPDGGMVLPGVPTLAGKVLTDHRIDQLPWWSGTLTVLRPPVGHGLRASADAAVRTVWRSRTFDGFVSANVRNALALGFVKRCLGRRRPALVMTEVRLDDPQPGIRWRIKVRLQRFAYAAADAVCVSARNEIDIYARRLRMPAERFHFVPWHTNVLEPAFHPPAGGYFFAAGRTGRDWRTLAAAVDGVDVQITVVCSASDARDVAFPPNVTVLTDIPYARYRELLRDASAVIVPLEQHAYSSGQVVILEAMALGKPVIAARVLGSEDYVSHGVDGLLVEPGNAGQLREAVMSLAANTALAERLGRSAVEKVLRDHTLDGYARRIVEITDEVLRRTC